MQKTKAEKLLRAGLICVFAVYILAVLKLVGLDISNIIGVFKYGIMNERCLQLVPFEFVRDVVEHKSTFDVLMKNDLGNLAMFIPLGILLPLFFKRLDFWRTVLLGFAASLFIEVTQYALNLGICDIDDLIINTLGAFAGAGIYFGILKRARTPLRAVLSSFIFLCVFGACGVLSLWLYHPSALPAQIAYHNESVFGGIGKDSYDISATYMGIEDGKLLMRKGSVYENDEGYTPVDAESFPLADGAVFILEKKTFQYSPNGNIQKTDIEYSSVTQSEAEAEIEKTDGGFADIWLNKSGECSMLVFTVFVN